ncbi:hypothetical protein ACTU44_06290 [Thalassospira sp. SM2505]
MDHVMPLQSMPQGCDLHEIRARTRNQVKFHRHPTITMGNSGHLTYPNGYGELHITFFGIGIFCLTPRQTVPAKPINPQSLIYAFLMKIENAWMV